MLNSIPSKTKRINFSNAVYLLKTILYDYCVDLFSMAVHPDKVTIATGQVAGHDKTEGKVSQSVVCNYRLQLLLRGLSQTLCYLLRDTSSLLMLVYY